MFKCDCCGLCCMNLNKSAMYADLDRGDGICKFFDIESKLCSIYAYRPDKCNVDKMYVNFFQNEISLGEYYKLNYDACQRLKREDGKAEEIV